MAVNLGLVAAMIESDQAPDTKFLWRKLDAPAPGGNFVGFFKYIDGDWQEVFPDFPIYTTLNDLKNYSGDSSILIFKTTYRDLMVAGDEIDVTLLLVYDAATLPNGGNDLTRIQSTAKAGHWRAITASPAIVKDHDFGGAGANKLPSNIFKDLTIKDIRISGPFQDFRWDLEKITYDGDDATLEFSNKIYDKVKIEIL